MTYINENIRIFKFMIYFSIIFEKRIAVINVLLMKVVVAEGGEILCFGKMRPF